MRCVYVLVCLYEKDASIVVYCIMCKKADTTNRHTYSLTQESGARGRGAGEGRAEVCVCVCMRVCICVRVNTSP
jgi:hypothetical protein